MHTLCAVLDDGGYRKPQSQEEARHFEPSEKSNPFPTNHPSRLGGDKSKTIDSE